MSGEITPGLALMFQRENALGLASRGVIRQTSLSTAEKDCECGGKIIFLEHVGTGITVTHTVNEPPLPPYCDAWRDEEWFVPTEVSPRQPLWMVSRWYREQQALRVAELREAREREQISNDPVVLKTRRKRWLKANEEAKAELASEGMPEPENVDLTDYLVTGEGLPEGGDPPRWLARDDGEALLYPGRLNWIVGASEHGKTWVALLAVADALAAGARAVYCDLDGNGVTELAEHLRLSLGERKPGEGAGLSYTTGLPDSETVAEEALVVLDTATHMYGFTGGNPNVGADWITLFTDVIKPLLAKRCTVLVLDHVAKGESSGRHGPTGAHEKVGTTTGVMLRVVASRRFQPGKGGRAMVTVIKDRGGLVRRVCGETGGDYDEPIAGHYDLPPSGTPFIEPARPVVQVSDEGITVDLDAAEDSLSVDARKVLKAVRAAGPGGIEKADIAKATRLSEEQVRACLDTRKTLRSTGLVTASGNTKSTRYRAGQAS